MHTTTAAQRTARLWAELAAHEDEEHGPFCGCHDCNDSREA